MPQSKVIPYDKEYDLELTCPISSVHRVASTTGLPTCGRFVPRTERKLPMSKLMEDMVKPSKSLLLC